MFSKTQTFKLRTNLGNKDVMAALDTTINVMLKIEKQSQFS